MKIGDEEGQVCGRDGCKGVLELTPHQGCSCHISPPCSNCTDRETCCPVCGWESRTIVMNDFKIKTDPGRDKFISWEPRPLDPTKIDYRTRSHTHFSQICEGVYPEGTTREQVLERVKGTFGGRFEHFGNGTFKYIAHTD